MIVENNNCGILYAFDMFGFVQQKLKICHFLYWNFSLQ